MIRNVILDWSGTLVDDLPAVWQATNFVFRQAGVPELTLDQFRAEFSLPFRDFYDRFVPRVALPELEVWFHGEFRQAQDSVAELPHAREFLVFCRERALRTFVLSSVHADHYAVQARQTGFAPFIDHPYVGVGDKRMKIREMLATHQLAEAETLFIGDMQHDIETAKAGGIHSCAVLTGYNGLAQLRASQPDLIVEHLGELRHLLERHRFELPRPAAPHAERHPIVTVGALIFDDAERTLLVRTRKWSNLWGIPGGKTKFGEPSEAALRREVKEETNLDLIDVEFVLVQDCLHSTEFYRDEHFVLLNYTARCAGAPLVVLNHEAQEFRWVAWTEAGALPLNRPTQILRRAVEQRRNQTANP